MIKAARFIPIAHTANLSVRLGFWWSLVVVGCKVQAILHAEIAPGLGETLASGARGTAWRLAVNKASGITPHLSPPTCVHVSLYHSVCEIPQGNCISGSSAGDTTMLAFANFSTALVAPDAKQSSAASECFQLIPRTVDYSKQPLSVHQTERQKVCSSYHTMAAALGFLSISVWTCTTIPISGRECVLSQIGERLSEVGVALETVFGGPQDVEGALVGDRIFVVQSRPQP